MNTKANTAGIETEHDPAGVAPEATPAIDTRITPSQKAAAIIAVLGEEAAKPIVEKLNEADLARIMTALEQISVLPRRELVKIVADFLHQLSESIGAVRGGRDQARSLISALLGPERASGLLEGGLDEPSAEPNSPDAVWIQMQARDSVRVAGYLDGLTPNIIAIILRKLDVAKTSEILTHIDEAKIVPVMRFLMSPQDEDPGLEAVIARMLQLEFLNAGAVSEGGQEAWLEQIGELLTLVPQERRERILEYLKTEHEARLPTIQKGLLSLDALPDILPRAAVPTIFREMDNEILISFLKMASERAPQLGEFLLSSISSRMADQLRDELESRKASPAQDVEEIERQFLAALMELRQRGTITLEMAPVKGAA